jgi:protein ImuA
MTQPSALSVLRNRTEVAEELRRLLSKIEGFQSAKHVKPVPFGLAAIDRCLPQGGLSGAALHEIVPEQGATPAGFGFMVALLTCVPSPRPLLFVMPSYGLCDYGRPYSHGLAALGLDPGCLIVVQTAHRKETLWALEEALHSRAPAAVAGILDKLDLKLSQRLQLAAADAGLPLFLLRPAEILESSAAATCWRIGTAEAARDRFGLIMHSRWRLMLERCRNGRTGEWLVEYDHVAHRFSLAAAVADPARARGAGEEALKQAG